jgi:phosphoribosylamine--glycine ligase
LQWDPGAAVAVVLASEGYPDSPVTGGVVSGLQVASDGAAVVVHAGTAVDANGNLISAGGRVLAVVGTGADLHSAREVAYRSIAQISLAGSHHRRDIAQRAAGDSAQGVADDGAQVAAESGAGAS